MYCNSSNLVGGKMVTPSIEFDPAIYWCIDHSNDGIISAESVVARIEKLVESNDFSLMPEDMVHISKILILRMQTLRE